jgi:hypothetical protein
VRAACFCPRRGTAEFIDGGLPSGVRAAVAPVRRVRVLHPVLLDGPRVRVCAGSKT